MCVCVCVCVCARARMWVGVCAYVGGCVGGCVRAACARVCVRVRVYEYVGVIPYMDATFKVSRLAE